MKYVFRNTCDLLVLSLVLGFDSQLCSNQAAYYKTPLRREESFPWCCRYRSESSNQRYAFE